MMQHQHIGDDAALYALGVLTNAEVQRVDEAARVCDTCAAALATAFDDVTALAEADVQFETPPGFGPMRDAPPQHRAFARNPRMFVPVWLATAAAIVIGVMPSLYFYGQNRAMHDAMSMEQQAFTRVMSEPHRTVAFAGSDARVMYAPDGSWYCVVINGERVPMHVMWPHDGTQTDLGATKVAGATGMLYLPKSHRMGELQLVADDGSIMGKATLVF